MASPEAECLNLSALLSFIVFPENGVEDILNTWLTGMCSVGSCSDAALDTLIGGIVNQCSGDLAAFGVSSDVTEKVVDIVKKAYPTAREIVYVLLTSLLSEALLILTLANFDPMQMLEGVRISARTCFHLEG